jgi:asparagine synthetase B (glutamine-hydrolysing)
MCGIYVNVHDIRVTRSPESLEAEAELRKACADRGWCCFGDLHCTKRLIYLYHTGPDARSLRSIRRGHIQADFYAAELCLRGSDPVVQPHVDSQENILCWNGEVRSL